MPKDYLGNEITDKKDIWNFQDSTCVTEYPDNFIPATSSATSTAMPVKIVGYDFSTITTSTDFKVDPVITGGEIIIIFFLVLFSFFMLLRFLAKSIDRITTNKKYLGYHGGDVEIRKDI
jgi:hypothetical protein